MAQIDKQNDRNPMLTSISTLDILEVPDEYRYGNCSYVTVLKKK
jgi:hypothetical protein